MLKPPNKSHRRGTNGDHRAIPLRSHAHVDVAAPGHHRLICRSAHSAPNPVAYRWHSERVVVWCRAGRWHGRVLGRVSAPRAPL